MRNLRFRWMAFPLAYYAANAVWQGYMSLYYRSIGFGDGKIGIISATMALSALAVQPLWGRAGDVMSRANRLLSAIAIAAALILPLSLVGHGFWLQIIAASAFYAFYCALLPMGDALLLQRLNRDHLPFGGYRLAGAVSFAVSGAVFGWILERSHPGWTQIITCGLLVLAALSAWILPENTVRKREKPSFRVLLKDRELMRLLAFMIPVQMTMGYFYTFFATYFDALPGAGSGLLGMGYAIATASEIPYLVFCDKIFRKFGAAIPMCISALVLMLRWLLLGFGSSVWIALASQLLHGGGFIVMTVSMAKFIANHVPPNLQSSGQMLLSMASFGVARVTGNLGGGYLAEKIGGSGVFLLCAGICLAAVCVFAPKAFHSRT